MRKLPETLFRDVTTILPLAMQFLNPDRKASSPIADTLGSFLPLSGRFAGLGFLCNDQGSAAKLNVSFLH